MGSIIEMVVVLVASALLTIQGIKEDVAHRRATLLAAEGQNESTINQALGTWVTDNYATLLAQYNPGNPQPLTPPTIDTLFTSGSLKQPHHNGPFWGGVYSIQMTMVPANCSASAGNCHVSYILYPSLPITRNGQPDVVGAAQIAEAGGAAFGFSKMQNSGTVFGLNGSWSAANPLGGSPAAAIVATNANATDGNSVYIRRDGSLTWTGDQNVNGVSLHNVKNLDATGNISAATATLQGGNALNIGGGAIIYGDSTNAAIRTNGAVYLQNPTATAPADLALVGNVNSTGTVSAQTVNFNTTAANCTWNTVTMRANNQMFVCNQWGNWIPISQLINNVMTVSKYFNMTDGSTVAKPSCTSGTPTYTIVPQNIALNVAANPPWESSVYRLNDLGSYWYVQISLQDANGNWYSGNSLGLTAEVQAQCSYTNE